jgi:hypothetical protein
MDNNMAVQLAPVGGQQQGQDDGGYGGSMRGRHNRSNTATSMSMRGMSLYEGAGPVQPATGGSRVRSKSVAADPNRYTRDGRPILHFGELFSPFFYPCNGGFARRALVGDGC